MGKTTCQQTEDLRSIPGTHKGKIYCISCSLNSLWIYTHLIYYIVISISMTKLLNYDRKCPARCLLTLFPWDRDFHNLGATLAASNPLWTSCLTPQGCSTGGVSMPRFLLVCIILYECWVFEFISSCCTSAFYLWSPSLDLRFFLISFSYSILK